MKASPFAVLLLVVLASNLLKRRFSHPPVNDPRAFSRKGRSVTTKTLVVCAGDSLTHGINSGDYVSQLSRQLGNQGYEFVNAGINGDLTYNLRQRLDDIIACQPDVVTFLIGTNDVLGTLNEMWVRYYSFSKKIPQSPTLEWFCQNLSAILLRMSEETDARIALLSMPMLGEELESDVNRQVNRYNNVVQEVAALFNIDYLPLNEKVSAFIEKSSSASHRSFDGAFRQTIQGTMVATLHHQLLGRSWDDIASREGFALLIDQIHLSDRGAAFIAELIGGWLAQQAG